MIFFNFSGTDGQVDDTGFLEQGPSEDKFLAHPRDMRKNGDRKSMKRSLQDLDKPSPIMVCTAGDGQNP